MSSIFEFYAASAPDEIPSRLLLGAICKRWRQITWETPSLWSTIHVNLDTCQPHVELLSQWLRRSGQLPLSIRISSNADCIRFSMVEPPFSVLNQYSSRWSNLNISLPFAFLPFLSRSGTSSSNLKTLTILPPVDSDDKLADQGKGVFKLSNGDPHPDTISIRGLSFNAVHVDWSNVTDVHFEGITLLDCMCLFKQASRLIKCSITTEDDGSILHFDTPLIHPSIAHLIIVFSLWDTPDDLFDRISLPALTEMDFTVRQSDYDSFISLIERSSCILSSLSITNQKPPTAEDLANLLWTTSSLENFALKVPHIPPNLFELFSLPDSNDEGEIHPIFLPLLRTFQYRGGSSHLSWKSFIEACTLILRIRRKKEAALPSFEFVLDLKDKDPDSASSQAELNKVTVACLCSLIDQGIGLKISNSSGDILQQAKRRYKAERFGVGGFDEESE
ncbi:unnamed protein product [Cyclocybe aegerita]|uniref:F-box domain-containing protein n=1 Tax=Cyclocybe aegerita TaxID=1973307 RepID=A0A8S0W0X3_CYCAE|nr:unnamed protein product [Cyclocybe aegerita]